MSADIGHVSWPSVIPVMFDWEGERAWHFISTNFVAEVSPLAYCLHHFFFLSILSLPYLKSDNTCTCTCTCIARLSYNMLRGKSYLNIECFVLGRTPCRAESSTFSISGTINSCRRHIDLLSNNTGHQQCTTNREKKQHNSKVHWTCVHTGQRSSQLQDKTTCITLITTKCTDEHVYVIHYVYQGVEHTFTMHVYTQVFLNNHRQCGVFNT